jgi:LPS export ABC transporter permease LptG/LPS export ABC transporter permease LptF
VLPPTLLGLLLFSFILMLEAISRLMGILVSRGADLATIFRIFLNLVPSVLAMTVPMSFLLGVLLAFGRMAADSEVVALRASGLSVGRLLRPVVLLSLLATGLTYYITAFALPHANQRYREEFFALVVSKARSGIQPGVFTDDLLPPGMMLYVSDIPAGSGRWHDVFLYDTPTSETPRVILAEEGEPVFDYETRTAHLRFERGVIHSFNKIDPRRYEQQRFSAFEKPLDWDELFPRQTISRGDREMEPVDLLQKAADLRALGEPPEKVAPWVVEWHKRFAIPAACVVFGLLGLGLSLGAKREARSAAFGLSVAVIFVYYVFIRLGEQAGDTGMMPPVLAMWSANVILGGLGIALLVLNHREAAFDPLDPAHYALWLPRVRRAREGARDRAPEVSAAGAVERGAQVRFVIRVPRLAMPAPSLLDRYIARAYLGHLLLVMLSFWAIYLLANFMDLFDDIQQNKVKGVVVLHYYAYHNPQIFYLILPVAALVTPLVTFGVLSRRNETTAMKAGGISLYRAVAPVILLGVTLSGLLFVLGDYVLPYTNRVAQRDHNVIKGRPPQSTNVLEERWILGPDDRIYNYDFLSEGKPRDRGVAAGGAVFDEAQIFGLTVYDMDTEAWALRDVLYVNRAVWQGAGYKLERGWRLRLGDSPAFTMLPSAETRDIEPPDYFVQLTPESDTLRLGQLAGYIQVQERKGLDVTRLKVQLHRKLAFPTVSLVMTLIGIPFAFVVGRRGALYGIGVSIMIAIVYWACLSIFEALGNSALLPPLLAAWAPNLLFGAAGLYLMLTLDT